MTNIYQCEIELHDNLYYATREIGRLYETEAILHNYSLCYALGFVDSEKYQTTVNDEDSYNYFCQEQIPKYKQHLTRLNEQGIYITPARTINHNSVLNTWKYANNNYHVKMEKTQKNIPSFGRNKEISPESKFECFIISKNSLKKDNISNIWQWKIPKFIRLGKWMSKAEIKIKKLEYKIRKNTNFTCTYPLNPLDVMFTNQLISYDVINMPPVSLIKNVTMRGDYYQISLNENSKQLINIPVNMNYRFE
ncbi:type I-D CRISPR-associated protein Cas5/Csc1 [Geminocystis sp. CENA526]|uniref:type I-D CRISPR-associated protein Cas5/Csc1 n=1 Tax=Geminocystis sp. CENA526 TaxID=1355871 RepID=UPI003D6FDEE4